MSSVSTSARVLNPRYARSLGWPGRLPVAFVTDYPGLSAPVDSREFAEAVWMVQCQLWPLDIRQQDGVLGSKTWERMLEMVAAPHRKQSFILNGARMSSSVDLPGLETYLEEGALNLQIRGDYSRSSSRKFKRIVLHWGGYDAPSCARALINAGLSSHFGVDRTRIHQWLDLEVVGWHAGRAGNVDSIGIDICQAVVGAKIYANNSDSALRALKYVDNTSGRGEKRCFPLDARTAESTRKLVQELCLTFDIPFKGPGHNRVLSAAEVRNFSGILGHHHISSQKWDVAPWWSTIFPA